MVGKMSYGKIGERRAAGAAAMEVYAKFKSEKAALDARITANEKWFKGRHWEQFRNRYEGSSENLPEPASAWLFNALATKHADLADSYPEPCILPREESDEADAASLSAIVPVILEQNGFEEVYSREGWNLIKNGMGCFGVFWNPSAEFGLGDISIREIDIRRLYFDLTVSDIQESSDVFYEQRTDLSKVISRYPEMAGKIAADAYGKVIIIDRYYKKTVSGCEVLHFMKLCGGEVLFATEDYPEVYPNGLYEHGKYPFIPDVLFPEAFSPAGFGYIDIAKDPQMYIDKLNQIIITNALLSGKKRFLVSDGCAVDEAELLDFGKNIVHCGSRIDESGFRELEVSPLNSQVLDMLKFKVEELKETAANRDVNQGSVNGGVVAAAAISALQEAGGKLSRDLIRGSYCTYSKIIVLVIELIRQFYDAERCFRIEGEPGKRRYLKYSNKSLKGGRRPIFDVKVSAIRGNPFSKTARDELAKSLYSLGFFKKENAAEALMALDIMTFEGKELIAEKIRTEALCDG